MRKMIVQFVIIIIAVFSAAVFAQTTIDTPKTKWRFKTDGPIRGDAVIHDDQVFFGSADGYFYSLNSKDGAENWRFDTQGAIVGTPGVDDALAIVINRNNIVYALNTQTGKQIWSFAMATDKAEGDWGWNYFTAAPVVREKRIYVGSGDGNLYTLNRKDGRPLWKFTTKGRIRATPLITDDTIYQPSNDGFIYALNADTGKLIWKFETAGATFDSSQFGFDRNSIYTQPILRNNTLYVGSRDGNVYAINARTGAKKWTFAYDTTWAMSLAVDSNAVYVGWSTNHLVSALDIETGKELWQFKNDAYVYTTPLLTDHDIYFGSADGNLYCLDKKNGKEQWKYDIGREIYSSPVFDHDKTALMFGSDNGYFYAIEQGAKPHKAIFLPTKIEGISQYTVADGEIAPYLIARGFVQLDEHSLEQFISARIADQTPSTIVFLLPVIPPRVIGANPAEGLMRQYLEKGGKVIWFGDAPNYFEVNAEGNFTRSAASASKLLDVEFTNLNESGNYYSESTQAGKNWGLPNWIKTTAAPVKNQNITPLAIDEFGRVSAFIKTFNPRPGSGYVSLRTWPWSAPLRQQDLELIYEVAVYGLE